MNKYSIARTIYRQLDRWLLQRLPTGLEERTRRIIFRLARRLFPDRIKARSAREIVAPVDGRKSTGSRLPAWAAAEVASLVELEPLLASLVGEAAQVEPYAVPWDMNYVGLRYVDARRRLKGSYATLLLVGENQQIEACELHSLPRPIALIDVSNEGAWAAVAEAINADYAALHAEYLDATDHCAVLARLVLQLAPVQVLYLPHSIIDRCLDQHGKAMASVTMLAPLDTDRKSGSGPEMCHPSPVLGIGVHAAAQAAPRATELPAGQHED